MHINIEDELKNIQSIENLIQSRAQSDVFIPRTLVFRGYRKYKPINLFLQTKIKDKVVYA